MNSPLGNTHGGVFIAGHRGLVGSAILRKLLREGYKNLPTATHDQLELTQRAAVEDFFEKHRPSMVELAAAKVGGIVANSENPVALLRDNLAIQPNVIDACHRHAVRKLVFLGSSCIYPKHAPQPIVEGALLGAPLEPTNKAYAVAKIAGIKSCAAHNRQCGTNFLCLMPTNLHGPGDNYHPRDSHVLPALIRRAHEAKVRGRSALTVWGSGTPRRELMHVNDLASACHFALERLDAKDIGECINVGVGTDLSIREIAEIVMRVVGFRGGIEFDTSKPDGTPRKLLDVSALRSRGRRATVPLEHGIADAYDDFRARFAADTPTHQPATLS